MKIGNLSTGVGITYLILTYLYIHENVIKKNKYNFIVSRFSAFSIEQVRLLINALKNNGYLFLKTFADKIPRQDLENLISKYKYSLKQFKIRENHEPFGEHTHNVLFVVLEKIKL